jgi:hypothetical protein
MFGKNVRQQGQIRMREKYALHSQAYVVTIKGVWIDYYTHAHTPESSHRWW